MAVDVQSKSGGSVAQIALHGFDIVPGADSGNGVGMAKIVE